MKKKNEGVGKSIVKLKKRLLSNGNYSLYLECYWKGERNYETLNLYISSEPGRTTVEQNKSTLLLADQIRAQRVVDLQSGKYKLQQTKESGSFIEYFEAMTKARLGSYGNWGNWKGTLNHIRTFAKGKDVRFMDVDEQWLVAFKNFLLTEKLTSAKTKLSQNSCYSYYNKVKACLRLAYEEKYINENPAARVRGFKQGESKREFLTWEEIQAISKTSCRIRLLKEAFLFSVLTGLRWSDIMKLTWAEIRGNEVDGWFLQYKQQKTQTHEILPITKQARLLLGQKGDLSERVFQGVKYSAYTNVALNQWMMSSGIYRNITFHCARHTHATLLLSSGVDIYTVSKLLGHKHIQTTEIYTKVTNMKKNEAIAKIPILEL
ncbi:MAG: site-specific integrase [Cyclobacteriaceae bacterium]|nr:site-specific integrase [Cyclobacteriaceae bacterium]